MVTPTMAERRNICRVLLQLLRNITLAALFYALLFSIISLTSGPSKPRGKLGIPATLNKAGPADIIKVWKTGVRVKFAGSTQAVTINPHANVFNRPKTLVAAPNDAYWGSRPHVDTEADLNMLIEECRGTYAGVEKIRNVHDCLQFLSGGQDKYFRLPPPGQRASDNDPRKAEYHDADDHGRTRSSYVAVSEAKPAHQMDIGTCAGPIIPYHVYWSGRTSWRVEMFIKSYLYTQNLACSRLWIWLDTDKHMNAVDNMLVKDPLFARFLPFVERGDIVLKPWTFPSRIPLPKTEDNTDGLGYYKTPGYTNTQGETTVAEGLIDDKDGQQWLVLTPKQMTFLPVMVSDAVRFVVLHIHGGVYLDIDALLLRDMRPLLLPSNHSFAERWGAHPHPGDYNTAVLSLSANSSLSSYLIRAGVRMGLNFHPRVIGRMAWKDGRDNELAMLETAAFDPVWTEFNWDREGRCTVPCLRDYTQAFKGKEAAISNEWESFEGAQLPLLDPAVAAAGLDSLKHAEKSLKRQDGPRHRYRRGESSQEANVSSSSAAQSPVGEQLHGVSFSTTGDEEAELRRQGVIAEYDIEQDKYPPTNRTLENFFRGSWSYHIHNQVCLLSLLPFFTLQLGFFCSGLEEFHS